MTEMSEATKERQESYQLRIYLRVRAGQVIRTEMDISVIVDAGIPLSTLSDFSC